MGSIAEIDALVVGAGVGGIYATYRLSRLGFRLRCIDIASDVGGTWYWNRYPGAMSDTESYLYRYSWDKEDLRTYPWDRHYLYQPEILKYLQHIVDKHQLRQYMSFETEMVDAIWDDTQEYWRITTSTGEVILARYLVNSLGLLSRPNFPDIPGIDSYKGELVHTAKWDDKLCLKGKKVGIIGNGSTGVQVMTALAPIVGSLKSFQRHPQYSVPSGQGPMLEVQRRSINENYDQIWDGVWNSTVGFGVPESTRKTMDATPEERREIFQKVWDQGNGFRFMFSAFGDLTVNEDANEEACKFIRSKIDEIVKDTRKASILKPNDLYARRPLCDTGYYSIFNRDNVDVIDLRSNPIEEIVAEGIRTADGMVHEIDTLIFATGFDAIEGNYTRILVTGKDGETLQNHWKNGPTAYGGVTCAGFPNMFIISGPQGPFANFPPVIESETDFIVSLIQAAEMVPAGTTADRKASRVIEVSQKGEQAWIDLCNQLVEGSLFKKTSSWIFGANVAGRKASTNFYFGGLKKYRDWCQSVLADGLQDFAHRSVEV